MTCREKLKMNHPENVDKAYFGGCSACPSTYGYLDKPTYCNDTDYGTGSKRCTDCWDREIPGLHKITPEFDIHALIDRCMEKRDRSVHLYFNENGMSVCIYPYSEDGE